MPSIVLIIETQSCPTAKLRFVFLPVMGKITQVIPVTLQDIALLELMGFVDLALLGNLDMWKVLTQRIIILVFKFYTFKERTHEKPILLPHSFYPICTWH